MGSRGKKGISIYELARLTGFSGATVSRVLNGKSNTSAAAREKITAAAAKFHFKPATCLRRRAIGLVLDININFYSCYLDMMLHGLITETTRRGVNIELYTRHNYGTASRTRLDGLIVIPWDEACRTWAASLTDIPKVFINEPPKAGQYCIYSDHYASGRQAAEWFIAQGYSKAAILRDSLDWGGQERFRGFRQCFLEHTGAFDDNLAAVNSWRSNRQNDSAPAIALFRRRPRALFLAGEDQLQVYLRHLENLGIRIPGDMEIVTAANPIIQPYLQATVTTITQPFAAMQQAAVDTLLRLLAGEKPASEQVFANILTPRRTQS